MILFKHKMNKILYILVRKVVFEQLKLCHLERIAFHRNGRLSCVKHPLKIVPRSVNPFKVCMNLKLVIQRNTRN